MDLGYAQNSKRGDGHVPRRLGFEDGVAEIAAEESKPVAELLRELVRERVARKARRQFEAEARRQSLEAAAVSQDPRSDEAAVMGELEAELEEFSDEWK
jgi:hypothetical protein